MRGGWIKVWREITEHPVFSDADLLKLFLWLVLNATKKSVEVPYRIGKGNRVFRLQPGELLGGRDRIADELHLPSSTIRNRLRRLAEMGCISISEDSQKPIIRVENYDVWQATKENIGQPKDSQKDSQNGQPKDSQRGQPKNPKRGQSKRTGKQSKFPSEIVSNEFAEDSQKVTDQDSQRTAKEDSQKIPKKDRIQEDTRRLPLTPKGKNEGEEKKSIRDAIDLSIPPALDSSEFRAAWSRYCHWCHAMDGRALNSISGQARLTDLVRRDSICPGRAIADIDLTIKCANRTTSIWDSTREIKNKKSDPAQSAAEIYRRGRK